MSPQLIFDFWFSQLTIDDWFDQSNEIDGEIARRFGQTLTHAKRCELFSWRQTVQGRLAEIIVLDQFSRNIHRSSPLAYEADPLALALAQEMVSHQLDTQLGTQEQAFCYMPYMHSESLQIHDQALKLFSKPGLEEHLEYEIAHREIIEKFGRYPHRNKILGRDSSPEELEFLLNHPGF